MISSLSISSKDKKIDLYNVDNYTDDELYHLLDLTNPSDKVLEAKLLFMINKYRYIQNEKGKQFTQFFTDIFHRFFPDSDSETESDIESDNDLYTSEPKEGFITQKDYITALEKMTKDENKERNRFVSGNTIVTSNTIVNGNTIVGNIYGNVAGNIQTYQNPANADPANRGILEDIAPPEQRNKVVAKSFEINSNVDVVTQVDYKKDNLNPILKQTIKRVINIDSSKRDRSKFASSTSFSFNLSEPLRDVLSLKLYSIHLPYTWYTVNKNFGGNFFYIKGNSPGIDLGYADYKIEIKSANYTNIGLVDEINTKITALKNTYTDISFGNTILSYDPDTVKTTITIDITYIFNEVNYGFQFSKWTTPNNENTRYNTSVAAYLGFNYISYDIGSIYSYPILPLDTAAIQTTESSNTIYDLSSTNCKVYLLEVNLTDISINDTTFTENGNFISTIDSYIQNPVNANNIIHTFDLSTKLSFGKYSRTVLQDTFSTLLASYNTSTIERINITNQDIIGNTKSYYKIHINVYNLKNIPNLKYLLVFPPESTQTQPNPTPQNPFIWVGNGNSCFCFKKRVHVLSDLIAETESLQSNYILSKGPYIDLICITDKYKNNSVNNYRINIPATPVDTTYTFNQYISAINNAITSSSKPAIINAATSGAYSNSQTDNKLKIQLDIVKGFYTSNYLIYFSDKFKELFNLIQPTGGDIPSDGKFTSIINFRSNFDISTNIPLFTIFPKTTTNDGNEGTDPFVVKTALIEGQTVFSGGREQMKDYISNSITNFIDPITETSPLSGSSFDIKVNTANGGIFNVELNISVSVILTENNYQIILQDPNAGYIDDNTNNNTNWNNTNTWKKDLKFSDQSYNLFDYPSGNSGYSVVTAAGVVSGYELTLPTEETIKFSADKPGVYSPDNSNSIILTVPAGTYTRSQLLSGLNTQLTQNQKTRGSAFFLTTDTTNPTNIRQYVNLRININKIYTTDDFKLVFYDPFSFVNCFQNADIKTGAQNATWDATIGWILGFRENTEYNLKDIASIGLTNKKSLTGDSQTSVYIYNYFLLVIDDFTQNLINDGLVSINIGENAPSITTARRRSVLYTCDPVTKQLIYNPIPSETQKQIYARSQENLANIIQEQKYLSRPYIKNIFGIIPVKLAGLTGGSVYTEFGGTLQNQERTYFGPVNIFKMKIQLINDRGEIVDLNTSDWSFSLICEQLYRQ